MTKVHAFVAFLVLCCSESRAREDVSPAPNHKLEDSLQAGFMRQDSVYSIQRIERLISRDDGTMYTTIRLYKTSLSNIYGQKKTTRYELIDKMLRINPANFLRWRLTRSDYLFGTECTLDDHTTGVFRVPLRIIKPIGNRSSKQLNSDWSNFTGMSNFYGGDPVIADIALFAWLDANADSSKNHLKLSTFPPSMDSVIHTDSETDEKRKRQERERGMTTSGGLKLRRLATKSQIECLFGELSCPYHLLGVNSIWFRGTKGIYFDFATQKDDRWITLFILFDRQQLKCSTIDYAPSKTNIIEMWKCEKSCGDRHFADNTFAGGELRSKVAFTPTQMFTGTIATDCSDPFYVFERNDDFYFVTISGKIYVAPHTAADSNKIERLITLLDDDAFSIREKTTRALRTIGKPAQELLTTHLPKSTSSEQKRRIVQLLDQIKPLPDRETKLLWSDETRPVAKLLFDLDNKKSYAFTKPNKEHQVYFFEIADKVRPRLFTGDLSPETPTSVPLSTRIFIEYARFVRNSK